MPENGHVEAEFADGYIHSEVALDDVSAFDPLRNVFYDVLNKLPEAEHGTMVRFSCYVDLADGRTQRLDVDWIGLPDNARPIRYRECQIVQNIGEGTIGPKEVTKIGFGYQYTDVDGHNVQDIQEFA